MGEVGESPTLGKFWGKFWKEGGNDRRGKKGKEEGKRGGKGRERQFETTKICLGCTKTEILGENFLTSPTFDYTPGNAPAAI